MIIHSRGVARRKVIRKRHSPLVNQPGNGKPTIEIAGLRGFPYQKMVIFRTLVHHDSPSPFWTNIDLTNRCQPFIGEPLPGPVPNPLLWPSATSPLPAPHHRMPRQNLRRWAARGSTWPQGLLSHEILPSLCVGTERQKVRNWVSNAACAGCRWAVKTWRDGSGRPWLEPPHGGLSWYSVMTCIIAYYNGRW